MSFVGNLYGRYAYFRHIGGRMEQARKFYLKGLEKGMDKPKYLSGCGVAMLRLGDFELAKEMFQKTLAHPKTPEAHKNANRLNLAVTLWKLGEIDESLQLFHQLEEDYPSAAVYGSLGYVLLDIGREEEALQYNLKRLEEYDETDPVMLDTVGQIYYRRGELDKAKEYFSEAVKIKNNLVDSLYYLGILEQRDGNIRRARAMLSRASRQHISTLNTVTREMVEEKFKELDELYDALSPEEKEAQAPKSAPKAQTHSDPTQKLKF
ncbi:MULTISPECIES: tetratricopeptide repeat protein [unclassified Clostridium]|uniref:tetratricopeptide repeat protein n=1 Tax=unclassified Clostridium TaxID=2614128 RepID=UPI001105BD48|nr:MULTISPECIES: tetratricopeptide repeat protein [unclassified Clostridium]